MGDFLSYWWVFLGIFLLSWVLLAITGSPSGEALGWAILSTMFFGLVIVGFLVAVKPIRTGGLPNPETYWPTQKLSQHQTEEWAEDLQEDRQSNSQIDDIINHYRANPDKLDFQK